MKKPNQIQMKLTLSTSTVRLLRTDALAVIAGGDSNSGSGYPSKILGKCGTGPNQG